MTFFSPDTDVLVLLIANYDQLPKDTRIAMGNKVLKIEPFWRALGPEKAKALLAFHAFSGADTTGRFHRIGKKTWFKLFLKANADVTDAFVRLANDTQVSEDVIPTLATFVCAAYNPKGVCISDLAELRWHLFCKHMAESERLPPTLEALKQHVFRAHIQARVWFQATVCSQDALDPIHHGYFR